MRERAFTAGLVVLAMSGAFLWLTAHVTAPLWYIPVQHRWSWTVTHGQIGMEWFFRAGGTLLAAAIAWGVGTAATMRSAYFRRVSVGTFTLGLGFAALFWAMLYVIFTLVSTPR